MPSAKLTPNAALREKLIERNVALWAAHHYSHSGRATAKDPISVCLVSPAMPERFFYGYGPTLEEAVDNCFAMSHNTALRIGIGGLVGAVAALEREIINVQEAVLKHRYNTYGDDLDDDIPF